MGFARGKYAKFISDRSGLAFPYSERVKEWNGAVVHISEFEPKHPQLDPVHHAADDIALMEARPDRTEPAVSILLGINPFKSGASGSAIITVTENNHGRSTSDTVRFRDAEGFDGFTAATIQNSSGYSITVVDTNSYTFTASAGTATTGNLVGGGKIASAGPVTLSA